MRKYTLLAVLTGLVAIAPLSRTDDNTVHKDRKTAHAGMGIASADFDALVQDLVASLDKFMVKEGDKQALLGVLGPMKKDIVEK